MEDNKNKSAGPGAGARDISDLKARLGLKKGPAAAGPAAGPTGAANVPAPTPAAAPSPFAASSPSIPAPVPAPIPAPPGFAPPPAAAEPAPPPIDPRRDPFAASQPAMPPAGYYGYAPIPGVDDGKPAEQISKPKPWGTIGVGAVALAALFGLGFSCGGIKWARGNMNRTIDQAADIKVEVEKMAKTLTLINDRIGTSADFSKGNPDVQLASDLGSLDLKKPETDKIFKTNYYYLEDLVIDRLFNYYNDTIILYGLIAQNAKKTENDKDAIDSFLKAAGGKGGDKNYGVTVDISGAIPIGSLVEIGSPLCPKEGDTDCKPTELKGFKYRTEAGGSWYTKPVKGPLGQTVIPIQKTGLFATLASGSPDMLAAKDSVRRLAEINLLSKKLLGEQKELITGLEKASDKKRKVNEYFLF